MNVRSTGYSVDWERGSSGIGGAQRFTAVSLSGTYGAIVTDDNDAWTFRVFALDTSGTITRGHALKRDQALAVCSALLAVM